MIFFSDGTRALTENEINELRLSITDPNSPWAILLEEFDEMVAREYYEELEQEHADFRDQLAAKEQENDALRARIAELEGIQSGSPTLDAAMASLKSKPHYKIK